MFSTYFVFVSPNCTVNKLSTAKGVSESSICELLKSDFCLWVTREHWSKYPTFFTLKMIKCIYLMAVTKMN